MKRCEFTTIQPSYVNYDTMPMIKKESTTCNQEASQTFYLPGDLTLNIEDILKVCGTNSTFGHCNTSSSSQTTLYMGGNEYEMAQNCEYSRLKASSTSSLSSPSLYSSISSHSNTNSEGINNTSQKRVSVVNSDENFIQYELFNPTLQNQSPQYFEQNSNELLRQLQGISQNEQNINNQQIRNVQETIQQYIYSMNQVKNIIQNNSTEISIDQKIIETINSNIKRVRQQTSSSKYYTYSIYLLGSNQIYNEVNKGISHNFVNFLSGSQQAYVDNILRFGDVEIFDSASRVYLTLSNMQSTIKSQQFNMINTVSDNNLMISRFDGKKLSVNCQSSLIPLTEPIFRQQMPIYYAYMRITEVNINESQEEQSCIDSSCSSSQNIVSSENSRLYEEYLQHCQTFQEKYYGVGSQRKKRYRKTKLQVEEELKYYLSLSVYNQQQQI